MKETDAESRLRRFLAAYERLCKKYSLTVLNDRVFERIGGRSGIDFLSIQIDMLKEGGINE